MAARIEEAFARLAKTPGYVERPEQVQLALLLGDLIEERRNGVFEAPTGLGKSLATLIPAIANALEHGTRTVIATYTNVLAEQYWRKDLPLALSLFEEEPKTAFLIGRQRYACLQAAQDLDPKLARDIKDHMRLGIETEFRSVVHKPYRELAQIWQKVATPPMCPGRLCNFYNDCFYYQARREAEKAGVVITNHSVVIMNAILSDAEEGNDSNLLGEYDFLILDEAHDFPDAATNGLEFEISPNRLGVLGGLSHRIQKTLEPVATRFFDEQLWVQINETYRRNLDNVQRALVAFNASLPQGGILRASPDSLEQHPQVQRARLVLEKGPAADIAIGLAEACGDYVKAIDTQIAAWKDKEPSEMLRIAAESAKSYFGYIREAGIGATRMFDPEGVAVTYAGSGRDPLLRQDLVSLQEPLRRLLWSKVPYACLSATMVLDGNFDFFCRTTGAEPDFTEALPSPFDFATQAALYLPAQGLIPDPSSARAAGTEESYFASVARELSEVIRLMGGRTLALFHSRREMEGVLKYMDVPEDLPILMQFKSGAASIGERFKAEPRASLFALRSFWTGFDAPGETCSCVVLVRVPFEVPVDPPQIARMAWLESQGLNPFAAHTLPQAKMLMRQGAGRLIRRAEDKGLIVLLDPRLRSKRYGEEILANLPADMRRFDDVADAIGWLGLGA